MDKKVCFKCGEEKSLSEFYKHKEMADGYLNKCKECNKKDVQKNYRENIDHYKAYEQNRAMLPHRVKAREKYRKTKEGKDAIQRARKKYKNNNQIKYHATCILNNAVRDGKIKKQPCEICGSTYRIHGHHDDYYKPLEVKWLCSKHHRKIHKDSKDNICLN
jgi:hypothetical protein